MVLSPHLLWEMETRKCLIVDVPVIAFEGSFALPQEAGWPHGVTRSKVERAFRSACEPPKLEEFGCGSSAGR